MLCQHCQEREATIHEVVIKNGVKDERHLCEPCAAELNLDPSPQASVQQVIGQFLSGSSAGGAGGAGATPAQALACPDCGRTFLKFKQTGLLGCATCYKAFERPISPMLERAHEGGGHHVGKIPRRALAASRLAKGQTIEELLGDAEERASRLAQLRKQLADAVRNEEYERAAQLRDLIEKTTVLLSSDEIDTAEPSKGDPSDQ
ncbi:MAG: UvrB/UvrC motif-containing protein [Planctomycetota bacterium]